MSEEDKTVDTWESKKLNMWNKDDVRLAVLAIDSDYKTYADRLHCLRINGLNLQRYMKQGEDELIAALEKCFQSIEGDSFGRNLVIEAIVERIKEKFDESKTADTLVGNKRRRMEDSEDTKEEKDKLRKYMKAFLDQKIQTNGSESITIEDILKDPRQYLGKKETLSLLKLPGFQLLGETLLRSDVLYVRAEEVFIYGTIMYYFRETWKAYHKEEKEEKNPFELCQKPKNFDKFFHTVTGESISNILYVCGNPGLGKTMKIYFMLYNALKFLPAIGFVRGKYYAAILSKDINRIEVLATVDEVDGSCWRKLNKLPLVIAESLNTDKYFDWLKSLCTTNLATNASASREQIKQLEKKAVVLFSGVHTYSEIVGINEITKKYLGEMVLRDRYDKVGGAPRYIFDDAKYEKRIGVMNATIEKIGERGISVVAGQNQFSHSVTDIRPLALNLAREVKKWRPYCYSLLNDHQKMEVIRATGRTIKIYKEQDNMSVAGEYFEELIGKLLQMGRRTLEMIDCFGKSDAISYHLSGDSFLNEATKPDWWPIYLRIMKNNYRERNFPCIDFAMLDFEENRLFCFDVTVSEGFKDSEKNVKTAKETKKFRVTFPRFSEMIHKMDLDLLKIPKDLKIFYCYVVPTWVKNTGVRMVAIPDLEEPTDENIDKMNKDQLKEELKKVGKLRGNSAKTGGELKEILKKYWADRTILCQLYKRVEIVSTSVDVGNLPIILPEIADTEKEIE
eukprot:CAMPEP_0184485354 /NCGR_PEP_ID=MMETSP0113_2-20130426/6968_1 /TAXON_ID=91329 /ORGANISM="Norrisiella sphaerica, Strain BC52" /LENGTH=733 /DNA_ID=CAMNT_0026866761 /DNA_START=369 /DNA_END=2570 /DNA_ORIENTATION=-